MESLHSLVNMYHENTEAISFLVSGTCTLNCQYCCIANKCNKAYIHLDNEITTAWKTGEYIDTASAVLDKLWVPNQNIKYFTLGLVESSIHIDLVAENAQKIFSTFPNIKRFTISTNFLGDMNKYLNLFKELEKYSTNRFSIYLLISIDGPDGELLEKGHRGNWKKYKENFEKLISFLNSEIFNNLSCIIFGIHSTVDKDVYLDYFDNDGNIYNYLSYLNNLCGNLYNSFEQNNVRFSYDLPVIASPSLFTKEESLKLKNIFERWKNISWKYFQENKFHDSLINPTEAFRCFYDFNNVYYSSTCFEPISGVTVLPDGTVADCLDTIIYSSDEYLESVKGTEEYKYASICNTFFFNPLNDEICNLQEKLWYFTSGTKMSQKLKLNILSGLLDEMALSNQIDYKYYSSDIEKMKALNFILGVEGCPRNAIKITGILQCPYTGTIRKTLNGIYPFVKDNYSRCSNPLTDFGESTLNIYPTQKMEQRNNNEQR